MEERSPSSGPPPAEGPVPAPWGELSHSQFDRAIASNAGWLFLAQLVALLAGMAVVVCVSRLLGAESLGQWRFAQAVAAYVLVIGDGGLGSLAAREIARNRAWLQSHASAVIILRTGFATLLLLVVTLVAFWAGVQAGMIAVLVLAGLTAVANSASAAPLLQGLELIGPTSRLRVATQTAAGLVAVALAVSTGSLVLVVVPLAVAPAIVAVVTLRWAAEQGAFGGPIAMATLAGPLIRAAWRFLVTAIAIQLLFNADALILQLTRGSEELGLYAAPYALASYLMIVGASVTQAAYPRIASRAGNKAAPGLLVEILGLMGLLGVPLAIGGIALSDQLVVLLFGPAYAAEGPILSLLLAFAALGFFNLTMGQAAMASGREHDAMLVAVVSAILNVGMNLVLIPLFGRAGAAWAVVASECSSVFLYCLYSRAPGWQSLVGNYASAVPAALLMGGVVIGARAAGLPVIPNIALGATTYLLINVARPSPGMRIILSLVRNGAAQWQR